MANHYPTCYLAVETSRRQELCRIPCWIFLVIMASSDLKRLYRGSYENQRDNRSAELFAQEYTRRGKSLLTIRLVKNDGISKKHGI